MRALITGGHGFVGRHLAQHLVSCGDDVALTYLPSRSDRSGIALSEQTSNQVKIPVICQSMAVDVCDSQAINQLIALLKPDVVYHLASLTFVPDGERDYRGMFETNCYGTFNILEAIAKHAPEARFLYVSSAEVYGEPRAGSLPLTEQSVLRPSSTYGVSKASADLTAYKYSQREGLHVVRVRPFPHVGPGQSERFAISSFAKQVAVAKLKKGTTSIKVGNLEVKRDYTDVSDIVRGYREAILNGKLGEVYNLCSGSSVSIGEQLKTLMDLAGVNLEIVVDPTRVREHDIADSFGSYDRAQKDFGWRPRVEREAMLDSLLAYWMEALSN